MKNTLYILVAVICFSCNDMLDIQPKGKIIPETYADYSKLLLGSYADANVALTSVLMLRTDNINLNPSGQNVAVYEDIFKWKDDAPSSVTFETRWQDLYTVLAYQNQIINNFEYDKNSSQAKQLLGEAYAIRALMNFRLLQMYSKPYELNILQTEQAAPIALKLDIEQTFLKSTMADMILQIENDMNEAAKLISVNEYTGVNKFRFSYKALQAMNLSFCMYKKDYKSAKVQAEALIGKQPLDSLIENYNANKFVEAYDYRSKENILALGKFNDLGNVVTADTNFAMMYDTADVRSSLYFENPNTRPIALKKHSDASKSCMYRYSDVVLTLAEIEARNNEVKNSQTYLLALLKNRLKPALYAKESARLKAISDNTIFLKEVLKERRKEFAFEDKRWFDLRNYGMPAISHSIGIQKYELQEKDSRYTLRFPMSAIKNNPRLLD